MRKREKNKNISGNTQKKKRKKEKMTEFMVFQRQ